MTMSTITADLDVDAPGPHEITLDSYGPQTIIDADGNRFELYEVEPGAAAYIACGQSELLTKHGVPVLVFVFGDIVEAVQVPACSRELRKSVRKFAL